jgi:hypothetical protein
MIWSSLAARVSHSSKVKAQLDVAIVFVGAREIFVDEEFVFGGDAVAEIEITDDLLGRVCVAGAVAGSWCALFGWWVGVRQCRYCRRA